MHRKPRTNTRLEWHEDKRKRLAHLNLRRAEIRPAEVDRREGSRAALVFQGESIINNV